jgi:hypothetical protein
MTVTHTSKHFEENLVLLKQEVSRYLERAICIVDHTYRPPSVLHGAPLVYAVCKEIAKKRGTPFVSVEYLPAISIINGVATKHARVKMPITVKAKPLSAHAMLIGVAKHGKYRSWTNGPIVFERKSSSIDVFYNGEKGMEALQTWLMMCETDNAMRFALGLPPKVSRAPSVQG